MLKVLNEVLSAWPGRALLCDINPYEGLDQEVLSLAAERSLSRRRVGAAEPSKLLPFGPWLAQCQLRISTHIGEGRG